MASEAHTARGCSEHRGRARRRPRVRRPPVLRQRDPDAAGGRPRRDRPPVHQLPLGPDVLSHAGCVAHGNGASFSRRRHGRPLRSRVPRLCDGDRAGRGDAPRDPSGERLGDLHGRQVAPHQGLGPVRLGPARLLALPTRLRPLLRLPRRFHEPAPAAPTDPGQLPRGARRVPRGLLPHRRPHRRGDLDDPRRTGLGSRQALLPLLLPRSGPRPPARAIRRDGGAPRRVRLRLGRDPGAPLPTSGRARRGRCRNRALAAELRAEQRRRSVERAVPAATRAQRPLHGGLRGHGGIGRRIDRSAARRPRGDGRARQHDLRVHLRQRGVTRRRGGGHHRLHGAPDRR